MAGRESTLLIDGIMTFNNNSAGNGGAIYIVLSDLQLLGNTSFENNTASSYAGAILAWKSTLLIDGIMTFNNNSAREGGALFITRSDLQLLGNTSFTASLYSGAISAWNSNLSLLGYANFSENLATGYEVEQFQLGTAICQSMEMQTLLKTVLKVEGQCIFTTQTFSCLAIQYSNITLFL